MWNMSDKWMKPNYNETRILMKEEEREKRRREKEERRRGENIDRNDHRNDE